MRQVALVGNQMEPAKTDTTDGRPGIRTIWGELAWQLGGQEAYGSSPTPTAPPQSRCVLRNCSPCIPRRDPHRRMGGVRTAIGELRAGCPPATSTPSSPLLRHSPKRPRPPREFRWSSIPASYDNRPDSSTSGDDVNDEEVGGEYGREALNRLKSIVGRTADHWLPANPQESFEIVRRRIFAAPDGATLAKISSIAKSLVDYYRRHSTEFPSEALEPAYIDRIKASYPIHPELFDRLYEDWSTLHCFQRTRGVLRMMNASSAPCGVVRTPGR